MFVERLSESALWEYTYNYRFSRLQAMILIQSPSLKSQQANGTGISAWIALELSFQYWTFLEKIQVCLGISGAAGWSFALGLHYVFMCEWFRSKKPNKNLCIHDFQDLIFKNLFQYFFMPIWYKSWPITSIPSISDHARNLEPIPCIKRFKRLGLVFSTYLF